MSHGVTNRSEEAKMVFFHLVQRHFCDILRCCWGRFRRSRSSKVDKFGANRKHVCEFLSVRNINFGPILHRFGDLIGFMCSWPYPYSTLILGVFPMHQIANVGRQRAHGRTLSYLAVKLWWNCILGDLCKLNKTYRSWRRTMSSFQFCWFFNGFSNFFSVNNIFCNQLTHIQHDANNVTTLPLRDVMLRCIIENVCVQSSSN